MDIIELQDTLSINSPFILKKKIEQEEQLHFKGNQIVINEEPLGGYSIEEKENYYCITCLNERFQLDEPLVIALDYKEKPVVLTSKGKHTDEGLKPEMLESLFRFIPKEQSHADEKAEL
jgi:hypothetical protein